MPRQTRNETTRFRGLKVVKLDTAHTSVNPYDLGGCADAVARSNDGLGDLNQYLFRDTRPSKPHASGGELSLKGGMGPEGTTSRNTAAQRFKTQTWPRIPEV